MRKRVEGKKCEKCDAAKHDCGPLAEQDRQEVGDQGRADERAEEGHDPDSDRGGQATPHVRGIDLHPGEEGQDDGGEGRYERHPGLALEGVYNFDDKGDGLHGYNIVKNDNGKVVFIKHIDNPKK
jgi:hypothetical protein